MWMVFSFQFEFSFYFFHLRLPDILADEADLADGVALGNGGLQVELAAEVRNNTAVATHGEVTEFGNFLIGAALLLPGLDQRAVVKVNVQMVVLHAADGVRRPLGRGHSRAFWPRR